MLREMDHIVEAVKARYSGNIAFRVACKLQSAMFRRRHVDEPASSKVGRKVAISFARFFPSKEDYVPDTIQKTGCPIGYRPYRKTLRIVGSDNVYAISILDFRDGRRIDSKILPPSKLSRGSNFERILECLPLACHNRVFPFSNCSQRVIAMAQPRSFTETDIFPRLT